MLTSKLFDPIDYIKPEFKFIKTYFEAWWHILQMEGIKFTYSSTNRAWEYGQILESIDFNGKTILDLGTSISLLPIYLVRMMNCHVVTFDKAFADERRAVYKKTGLEGNVEVYVGDLLEQLPFADGAFDIVTSFSTIEHLPSTDIPIKEMKRVCKKEGFIGLTTDFAFQKPTSEKSGKTFNLLEIEKLIKDFNIPIVGEKDYFNVDFSEPNNRAVGDYTFASIVLKNI